MSTQAKIIIAAAFSLSMLPSQQKVTWLWIRRIEKVEIVKQIIEEAKKKGIVIESAVGHEATAQLLTKLLGIEVPMRRVAVTMTPETALIVFQLLTRLPEGKILTEQEVQQLVEQGKATFFAVLMTSAPPSLLRLFEIGL